MKMIDGHVHIEKSPYTIEYIMEYVKQAQARGIDEINLLEHTHRFTEWKELYELARNAHPKMKEWLDNKNTISIQDYFKLIAKVKAMDLPVKLNFGLEVCYFKDKEDFIKEQLALFPYDFVIGSIHYVYDMAYDLDNISQAILWDVKNVNDIYRTYYKDTEHLICSGLFTQLAHMDTIKKYNLYPSYDLTDTYHHIAELLKKQGMKTECNVGCYYRYHHHDLGLSEELLDILKQHQVEIVPCSDAHQPSDVGIHFNEVKKRLYNERP